MTEVTSYPKPRTVRLTGKAYTVFRRRVFDAAGGICSECKTFAPLLDHNGQFNIFECGHVAHILGHGAGGGDVIENAKWKCPECHLCKQHGPQFSNHPEADDE